MSTARRGRTVRLMGYDRWWAAARCVAAKIGVLAWSMLAHDGQAQGASDGAALLSGAAEIVDGDTLRLSGISVRLHAIDAPEAGQTCLGAEGTRWACGAAATAALARMAAGGVRCRLRGADRYGRQVATCVDSTGRDIADGLVRSGAAYAWARYGTDYLDAERAARAARRGLWQGGPSRPEAGRRSAPAPHGETPRPTCRIKGNISGSGRIYHVPGQRHYARTQISQARGERWFCTETEAAAAGWRRARH